jgi:LacI family transcriptional regulator
VTRRAEEQGMAVLLANTRRQPEVEMDYVSMMRSQRARAVIIVGSRYAGRKANESFAAEIERFTAAGGRAACISQNRLGVDTVVPQNHQGARALATAMLDLGHRRFVVLAGPKDLLTARDRLRGFETAVAAHPDAECRVVHGPFTRDGGYAAAQELIELGFDETCLFAVNDVMAVGAMAALRAGGVRVPGDLSVAGFDDIETLRDLLPPLTTVRLPLEEMGAAVADMALQAPDAPTRVLKVDGTVVVRASTAAPPKR